MITILDKVIEIIPIIAESSLGQSILDWPFLKREKGK